MARKKIVFRADASHLTGAGHIYRLIAMAQMLYREFNCSFVSHNKPGFLQTELAVLGIPLLTVPSIEYSSPENKNTAAEVPFDMEEILSGEEIVILDGYWFGKEFQKGIKQKGCKLVCIDDLAVTDFFADIVINHAPGIKETDYEKKGASKYFLGLDYVLLRKDFLQSAVQLKPVNLNEHINTVLICTGATDPFNVTGEILSELQKSAQDLQVILLGRKPTTAELQFENISITHCQHLAPDEIIKLIQQSDIVITTPSTISLEVCTVGASLITIQTAANQHFVQTGLVAHGASVGIDKEQTGTLTGLINSLSLKKRLSMVSIQKKLIDGRSPERIIKVINQA